MKTGGEGWSVETRMQAILVFPPFRFFGLGPLLTRDTWSGKQKPKLIESLVPVFVARKLLFVTTNIVYLFASTSL